MGNEGSSRRRSNNSSCNDYKWDSKSAARKAKSNISVTVSTGVVSATKQVSGSHNPKTDAYRNCKNCGKHKNYHKKEKLPGK